MNGEDWLLVRAPGPAPGHQRAVARIETRFQEQLRKSRMGLIGATVVQTHFRVARQLEFAVTTAMIDERHHAYFSVGIRHDSDGTARLDIAIPSPELGAVGVKLESGFIGGLGAAVDCQSTMRCRSRPHGRNRTDPNSRAWHLRASGSHRGRARCCSQRRHS